MAAFTTKTPTNLEIPGEMRDFADRSVEQARKAVDGMLNSAQKAGSMAETSARLLHENATHLTSRAMQHAQANIRAAFDLAQALAHAKTLDEVASLQGNFIKAQIESLQAQASEIGEVVKRAAAKVTKV